MPIYRYKCKECGHEFEKRQRMSDDPLTECPVCGGEVRRVVGTVGIVFKGSGFYVTDNRSSNGKGRVQTTERASDTTTDDKSSEKTSEKSPDKKENKKPPKSEKKD